MNRIPPQNLAAEKSILGGLMLAPEAWDEISDLLEAEDFYSPAHKLIYASISILGQKGQPSDLITISNHLVEQKKLDSVGGPSYLAEILDETPSTVNILAYAKIVREKSLLRRVIHAGQGFVEKAFSQDFESLDAFLDECESKIFAVAEQQSTGVLTPSSEIIKKSIEKLEALYALKGDLTGIPSGFLELDQMSAGFQAGELVIVAARPSMGKTAFSLNILLHTALKAKKKIAYFSVEMSKEAVMTRLLGNEAQIPLSHMRTGQIRDYDWPRLINAAATISEGSIFIDDSADLSPFDVRAKARRMKSKHGLDMIIIDYLQLMALKTKVESREREVSEISRTLKAISKELQIPVIALAQLNRGVEGRSNRRPMLSDLRESGSIEQDADVIMMLYRKTTTIGIIQKFRGWQKSLLESSEMAPPALSSYSGFPNWGFFSII